MKLDLKTHLPTIIATSIGVVIVQIDVTIINIALIEIGKQFGTNLSGLQWIIESYVLVLASLLMLSGTLGERFGSKRIFIYGLGIFTIASVLCGLAQTSMQLIGFRVFQGFGAALIIPNSLALLNQACLGDFAVRTRSLGIWNASAGLATAIGPILGGILVDQIGWRSVFLINLPIGLFGIWVAYRFIDTKIILKSQMQFDFPGQILAIIMLLCLTTGIIIAGQIGWTNWLVISTLVMAFTAGYAFIRIETKSKSPMLPLYFFKNSQFSVSIFIGFLNNLSYYGSIFTLGLFFQNVLKYSIFKAGLAFIPLAIASIANLIGIRIAAKKGLRRPMVVGFLMASIGYVSIYGIDESMRYLFLFFPLMLISFGLGLAVPSTMAAILSSVDEKHSAIASAAFTTIRQAGGAIGVAFFGTLISSHITINAQGIRTVFIVCSCVTLAAAVMSVIWMSQSTGKTTIS